MSLVLSDEQRAAVTRAAGAAVHVNDPETGEAYVLIPAATYGRVSALVDKGDADVAETYFAQEAAAAAAGWDDPLMDEYNDYDAPRKP